MTKKWTRETIYSSPTAYSPAEPSPDDIKQNPSLFTADFLQAIKSDRFVGETQALTPADEELVGTGQKLCPLCQGSKIRHHRGIGQTSGIVLSRRVPCLCDPTSRFWGIWSRVPARWKDIRLESLEPLDDSKRQRRLVDDVKSDSASSYLLVGASGQGKTHFAYALYRQALQEWANDPHSANGCSVWWADVSSLLNAHSSQKQDPTKPNPTVTLALIDHLAGKGLRPRLFLDEIDKTPVTESKRSDLYALINKIYDHRGQIVATSNMSPLELADRWGDTMSDPIFRRFCKEPEGKTLFFSASKEGK
jgi:hypothetical protein